MENGDIVDQGNHEELLKKPDGAYALLYNSQFDLSSTNEKTSRKEN
jgi:ABC-type multidrug transport system fused ATPase/permease subunit